MGEKSSKEKIEAKMRGTPRRRSGEDDTEIITDAINAQLTPLGDPLRGAGDAPLVRIGISKATIRDAGSGRATDRMLSLRLPSPSMTCWM